MKRISTGIGSMDEQLGGGFPQASSVLLLSESPSEKRMFAEQFIVTGVRNSETCLYVDFYRSPSFARSHLRRYGITDEDD
ncbi:MAG: RAD55 family ATPase, partial [Thermoplasmata archaeon]